MRALGQATRVSRSQRAQRHSPEPGGFHRALLHCGQRAQPSVHAQPVRRRLASGQPRARHTAQRGSGPSTRRGHTSAHDQQSLHSSATTS